jgi:hypothetical protein
MARVRAGALVGAGRTQIERMIAIPAVNAVAKASCPELPIRTNASGRNTASSN